MALLTLTRITRRRTAAVRTEAVVDETAALPAPEPEPATAPVRTNPYAGMEAALAEGQARLGLMRSLRGY